MSPPAASLPASVARAYVRPLVPRAPVTGSLPLFVSPHPRCRLGAGSVSCYDSCGSAEDAGVFSALFNAAYNFLVAGFSCRTSTLFGVSCQQDPTHPQVFRAKAVSLLFGRDAQDAVRASEGIDENAPNAEGNSFGRVGCVSDERLHLKALPISSCATAVLVCSSVIIAEGQNVLLTEGVKLG